ncbi:3-keto-5-aminohexanoate cleavage protein [Agromyces sp. H3Y2-19a]|uniref:3-keto-5-aminohexanoate cleavage protein n=1 Tax=Agromyces TaxID=33877 RepID=UPI001E5EA239|nr:MULTISPECIES: 3-keto-5-aminohexanoate cleavage protein [Agromyces]MCD5345480.1 3-keto-5-aminohexanoate cleavage protein [Agromyces sp. S2-1-8]MDF0515420.1 3-keto-5-aminohexanoate cleavage protein [Agromyces chromiiresistens]
MLLKAAINGGRPTSEHPAVPRTIEQIVEASRAVIAAGADVVHAHVITEDGAQTIEPEAVGAWVRAMRAADPAIVIGTTTGLWTVESHAERMRHLAGWPGDALPDFASVAFCEEGAAEAAELVLERGMVLESAVWSIEDVPALLASPTLHRNVRILIEPETEDADDAVAECRRIAAVIRAAGVAAPILYHGYDATVWPVVEAAIADRCETRIGFEDGVHLPDGSLPAGNAELVAAVRALERG